ncbi:MAG: hypothetical protein DDT32_02257 [Syntrophomonadaceae bacterium]|nr:hypothetical protein [Bacillota bacterium]
MGKVRFKDFGQVDFWSEQVFSQLPPDPFLEAVAKNIDFSFADSRCEPFYSHLGQYAYAPSLMLRIRFLHTYFTLSFPSVRVWTALQPGLQKICRYTRQLLQLRPFQAGGL